MTHVSRQLAKRERELNEANDKIGKLKESIDDLQRKTDRFAAERDKVKRELEAMRELCHKLEIEKEKLNAEVNEYVEIRRELELENEKLRNELVQVGAIDDRKCDLHFFLLTFEIFYFHRMKCATNGIRFTQPPYDLIYYFLFCIGIERIVNK